MSAQSPVDVCKELTQRALEFAKKHGADAAEVCVRDGEEMTARVRLGKAEYVQEAQSRALGIRIFIDHRCAITSTSDMRPEALEAFVSDSVELAKLAEPDPLHTLPDTAELARDLPDLDLYDAEGGKIDAAEAIARAKRGEAAALAEDKRISNSEGATWSRTQGATAFGNSAGFLGGYRGTYSAFYVQPIADDADGKKRNGMWWTAHRFLGDLEEPEAVGAKAARRTVEQIGSRKVATCEVPVIFDPEAGRAIVGMLFGVANGSAFYRKSTYLLGREETPVASELVTIEDDPLIPRGPGSRPFDGDGLPSRKNQLVDKGILKSVLCDVYTARKLGRRSTGSAGRGVGGGPAPTTSNLMMHPGTSSRADILRDTPRGLYVNSMMGFGFNPVTGDFSRGASGFWIENGEFVHPVSEVTISVNFDELLKRIDRMGDDPDRRSSTVCPTFRVSHMTIAGK